MLLNGRTKASDKDVTRHFAVEPLELKRRIGLLLLFIWLFGINTKHGVDSIRPHSTDGWQGITPHHVEDEDTSKGSREPHLR